MGTLFILERSYIARTCLTYMGFDHDFNNDRSIKYKLHRYVNEYWGNHVRNHSDNVGLEKPPILSSLLKYVESSDTTGICPPWDPVNISYVLAPNALKVSVSDILHYLVYFRLTDLLQYMLENGDTKADHIYYLDQHREHAARYTPLILAAERGHIEGCDSF